MSLNRVLLIGNLTKDPELRYTPSGTPVANLRMAVNSTFKDQSGAKKEETCFVTIVVWSKQAELCNQYLKKGRSIFVEGRLLYRSWEAEGKTRSTMEVRADRVQFLGGPAGGQAGLPAATDAAQAGGSREERESSEPMAGARVEDADAAPTTESGADADIPF
ncbi:MAG: single-stranded DNA-binding protein [Candidatus Omnitrophica bacterium]|nr:single-stranded DNA-binding protein [Candidatus Omnitrophota bacterium]